MTASDSTGRPSDPARRNVILGSAALVGAALLVADQTH